MGCPTELSISCSTLLLQIFTSDFKDIFYYLQHRSWLINVIVLPEPLVYILIPELCTFAATSYSYSSYELISVNYARSPI